MNETTTKPEIITDEQVAAINAARDALVEIANSAQDAGWHAPTSASVNGPYAHWYGAVAAIAEQADGTLFDLLNRASSCGILDLADDLLHNRESQGDGREPDGQRLEGGRMVPTDR